MGRFSSNLPFLIGIIFLMEKCTGEDPPPAPAAASNLPSAILYENEDKSGGSYSYMDDPGAFSNVEEGILSLYSLEKAALFCANGVFLLYNNENHYSQSDDEVSIFAGASADSCINPGGAKSYLLTQGVTDVSTNTLALFDENRFHGDSLLIINKDTANIALQLETAVTSNSFIKMGPSDWDVWTNEGNFCLKSTGGGDFPICPVAYTSKLFKGKTSVGFDNAKEGCTNGFPVKELTYCFNRGSGKLENITSGEEEKEISGGDELKGLMGGNNTEGGGAGGEEVTAPTSMFPSTETTDVCDYSDEFAMLLRLRLKHDINDIYQVQFPFNKRHTWRTEILDNTIEIVTSCVHDGLIDSDILRFVREMYIFLAEKFVWSEGKGWPPKPKQRILQVGHETERCMERIHSKNYGDAVVKLSDQILTNVKNSGISDEDIDSEFRYQRGFDLVMEYIYLSINFVGVACHTALEFETDFWMDYMNVAYDMYLKPMADFWKDPKHYLKLYPVILAGFNIESQYRGFAATTTLLYKTSSLDKLPRPPAVFEEGGTANAGNATG